MMNMMNALPTDFRAALNAMGKGYSAYSGGGRNLYGDRASIEWVRGLDFEVARLRAQVTRLRALAAHQENRN
jgi:hypothetical protein